MAQVTRQTHRIYPHQVGPNRLITVPSLIDMMHIVAWDSAEELGASVYDLHKDNAEVVENIATLFMELCEYGKWM